MAPLVVITGPTASGKTGLALALAEQYGGEIICADSRTIYAGMDIGTAKPTTAERARVPHHGLDVVQPGERFTAKDFQALARQAIDDIRARGKVPFLVGGTGLYIDAVVLDFKWPQQQHDPADFTEYPIEKLQSMIKTQRIPMPTNERNRLHLINALVRGGEAGHARDSPLENTIVVAIATDKLVLDERITTRAHEMFEQGVIEEAARLGERYGWDTIAMSSNIYPIIRRLLAGEISRQQAIEHFITRDRQLAKRQLTWLRRHDYVQWLSLADAKSYIETTLQEVC
jgi:tRNA dimethylallyltransferase